MQLGRTREARVCPVKKFYIDNSRITFNWLKANRHRRTRTQAPVRRVYLSWSRVVGTAVCVSINRVFFPFSIHPLLLVPGVLRLRGAPRINKCAGE